jgi:hypothetical protein
MPPIWSAISGDAIQNLRSALDHLAYCLFIASRASRSTSGRRIYFPIFESASQYAAHRGEKLNGVRLAATKLIDAIEPFKTPSLLQAIT